MKTCHNSKSNSRINFNLLRMTLTKRWPILKRIDPNTYRPRLKNINNLSKIGRNDGKQ